MFNLIHMNGRIYDSEIARFLSPDPIIQDPYNLLNYNRYSYCLNNPLKYNDPTGNIIENPGPPTIFYNPGWGDFAETRPGFHDYVESLGSPGGGGPNGEFTIGKKKEVESNPIIAKDEKDNSKVDNSIINSIQTGLDLLGLIPGIREFFDGPNSIIYSFRGDYINACLSASACIPFVGWGATGAKWTTKAIEYSKMADNIGSTKKIIEFQNTNPINTRILFNDITQGGTKRIIPTSNGPIIHSTMPDGNTVQLRNFSTNSPLDNHTTIQFIGGEPGKWKFNY